MEKTWKKLAALTIVATMLAADIPIQAEDAADEQQTLETATETSETVIETPETPAPETAIPTVKPMPPPTEAPPPELTAVPVETASPEPTAMPVETVPPEPAPETAPAPAEDQLQPEAPDPVGTQEDIPSPETAQTPAAEPPPEPVPETVPEDTAETAAEEEQISFEAKVEIKPDKRELYYGDELKVEAIVSEASMSYELKWEKLDPTLPEKEQKWELLGRDNPLRLKITEEAATLNYRLTVTGSNGETITKEFVMATPSYRIEEESEPEVTAEPVEEAESEAPPESAEEAESEMTPEPAEETESEMTPESAEEAEPEMPSEPAEEAESEAPSEPVEEAESETPSESAEEAKTEITSETVEEAEPEMPSEPAEEAESEAPSESAEEAKTEIASEPAEEAEPGTPSEPAEEAESETASESAEKAEPEITSEPVEEAESETSSEPAEETESEAPPEPADDADRMNEEPMFFFSSVYTENAFGSFGIDSLEGNIFPPETACSAEQAEVGNDELQTYFTEQFGETAPGDYRVLNAFTLGLSPEDEQWQSKRLDVDVELNESVPVRENEEILLLCKDEGKLKQVDSLKTETAESQLKGIQFSTSGLSTYAVVILQRNPTEEPEKTDDEPKIPDEENVRILTSFTGVIGYGEQIDLSSEVDGEVLSYQWECDKGQGFEKIEGANDPTYSFTATPESLSWNWRLTVIRP